jgi:hypothetical protein
MAQPGTIEPPAGAIEWKQVDRHAVTKLPDPTKANGIGCRSRLRA